MTAPLASCEEPIKVPNPFVDNAPVPAYGVPPQPPEVGAPTPPPPEVDGGTKDP
jgi:hypothetical protein